MSKTGICKFFNAEKGFGFITNEETGKDIFVHATGISADYLNEGDQVKYDEVEGKKGICADNVQLV
jgi:CspA family cold shock protein